LKPFCKTTNSDVKVDCATFRSRRRRVKFEMQYADCHCYDCDIVVRGIMADVLSDVYDQPCRDRRTKMIALMKFFDRRSPAQLFATALALMAAVAVLDHLTGAELSFSIFYLLPIVLVSWYSPRWQGYLFCGSAAIVWLLVDYASSHIYSNGLIPIWNSTVRFSFFLITATLLAELKARLKIEKAMAKADGLTGIFNARAFKELSGSFLDLAARHRHPVVLGYIDVDNFKAVNDNFGHSEGDRVLKAVAYTLARSVRATDIVGRLGGDEFAVFLPETDYAGAQVMFTRIHEELQSAAANGGWPIGFSVGVAVFTAGPDSIDVALKFADNLMSRVKKAGKNNLLYEVHAAVHED
jgi:diguanylate cyclase (GGDEF)-like protein